MEQVPYCRVKERSERERRKEQEKEELALEQVPYCRVKERSERERRKEQEEKLALEQVPCRQGNIQSSTSSSSKCCELQWPTDRPPRLYCEPPSSIMSHFSRKRRAYLNVADTDPQHCMYLFLQARRSLMGAAPPASRPTPPPPQAAVAPPAAPVVQQQQQLQQQLPPPPPVLPQPTPGTGVPVQCFLFFTFCIVQFDNNITVAELGSRLSAEYYSLL